MTNKESALNDNKRSGVAVLALLLNACIWGCSWWPLRHLEQDGVHPIFAVLIFSIVAVLWVLIWHRPAINELKNTPFLLVLGFAAGATNLCFNWAVTIGDVVRVVLLFYLMPAWTILLAWALLSEKPSTKAIFQLLISLLGVIFILKSPETPWPVPNSLADWLGIAGGFFFALCAVSLRRLSTVSSEATLLAMFSGGFTISLLGVGVGLSLDLVAPLPALDVSWLILVLGFSIAVVIGNMVFQYGAARLMARTTSLVMLSEILFATTSSALAGVAVITLQMMVGGALIVLATLWSVLDNR